MTLSRREKIAIGGGIGLIGAGVLYLLLRPKSGQISYARIDYVGNGSASQVIPVNGTPKMLTIYSTQGTNVLMVFIFDGTSCDCIQAQNAGGLFSADLQIHLAQSLVLHNGGVDVGVLTANYENVNMASQAYVMVVQ